MAEALVELCDVDIDYRQGEQEVKALDSVSCSVGPGDRIAIVGPSGSGKSTLLHVMGGLDAPSAGRVRWPALGPQKGLRPSRIALVFQAPSLLATLSVAENVALPLLLASTPRDEALQRAHEALRTFGLEELADKIPEDLSGGQAQRVAFTRAVAGRPQLLLADEPTGQLDQATAAHLLDLALDAAKRISAALVVATHDAFVAQRFSKRWQMAHGALDTIQ